MSDDTLYNKNKFYESLPAGHDGLFDWEFLRGALPRGIMPMDIDASEEMGGNFLWFETKRPDVPIPKGQQLALDANVRNGHTVIYLWGKSPEEFVKAQIEGPNRKTLRDIVPREGQSLAGAVYNIVQQWGVWADGHKYKHTTRAEYEHILSMLSQLTKIVKSYM